MPSNTKQKSRGQRRGGGNAGTSQPAQPQTPAFDGPPPESPSRGRAGSVTGTSVRASSRAGSRPPTASGTRASSQTRRVDPARDPPPAAPVLSRNVDFGGQAYDMFSTVSRHFSF